MSLRLSVQKSSSADGASINVKLQCLDRIIYNPPLPNQPTETFRCLLHRKNASNPLLARIRLDLLTRISIIIHIFCKFTIFKSFHSYWLVIHCCETLDLRVYWIIIKIIQNYGLQNYDEIFKNKFRLEALNCKLYRTFKCYYLYCICCYEQALIRLGHYMFFFFVF